MEYQKKRYTLSLITIMIFFFTKPVYSQEDIVPFVYNVIPVAKDLKLQKMISKCRFIVIPVIVAITLYCNQKNIIQLIEHYPIPFMLTSYFLGNCVIDSISKYRQINQTLEFFLFSQTMSRYMLCILAVKNSMKKLNMIKGLNFDEQDFLNKVIENTGYSMQNLETFTFELLNSSINSINNLCVDINTTDIEEKIYFLFKDQITLEQMLLICKDDDCVYPELLKFHQNPEKEYEHVLQSLCVLIYSHFNYFMKRNFIIDKKLN